MNAARRPSDLSRLRTTRLRDYTSAATGRRTRLSHGLSTEGRDRVRLPCREAEGFDHFVPASPALCESQLQRECLGCRSICKDVLAGTAAPQLRTGLPQLLTGHAPLAGHFFHESGHFLGRLPRAGGSAPGPSLTSRPATAIR